MENLGLRINLFAKKNLLRYYMSSQTNPTMSTPFPYYEPNEILAAMQNQTINSGIYDGTSRILAGLSDTNRYFTGEINGVSKDISQAVLGLRDAVERGNAANSLGVERNGANNMAVTERVGAQLSSAGERNSGNIMTAIERAAGEGRVTTTVTDAASRQAANDTARDILSAVERNGMATVSVTKDTHNGLLGAIERNAGENRMTTVTVGGQNDSKLVNVHNGLSGQLSNVEADVLSTVNLVAGDIKTGISNSAWESRTGISSGFAASMIEQAKNSAAINAQSAAHYSSLLLENAKSDGLITTQASNQYASLLLEQQKLKEYLASKTDNQFAMGQLELQKVRSDLSTQAANHFAINQLEQQKAREAIQMQLADAKYESLKSQQYLTDKMSECCCEVKQKIDLIDRDRLRDNLIVQRDDNNLLKILQLSGGLGGWDGRRSRSPGRR